MITKPKTQELPFEVKLIISEQHGKPQVEIRRRTTDPEIIKSLIACAFHNIPVIVQPTFTNRLQSLNTLIDKGIIYPESLEDGGKEYHFTF